LLDIRCAVSRSCALAEKNKVYARLTALVWFRVNWKLFSQMTFTPG